MASTITQPGIAGEALTLRDLEIARGELEGKSQDEIAEDVNVCRKTVYNARNKPAYRDLMLSALESQGFTVGQLAKNLVDLTEARKALNVDGDLEIVDDNVTRMSANRKLCDILGVDAPKEMDIRQLTASMSNDELQGVLNEQLNIRETNSSEAKINAESQ